MFVTQRETTGAIAEALNQLKEWNPDISPKYGITDYAWEEINALKSVWNEMVVFLCDFHCEQAWTRWCSKGNLGNISGAALLSRFRAVARGSTVQEAEEAYRELSELDGYVGSRAQRYFEETWWKEVERWSQAYEPLDLLYHSNNGTERLHETLKYMFLQDYKHCSLSALLKVVVTKFLPDRFREYMLANVQMMASHRAYNVNLDVALHEKPLSVISALRTSEGRVRRDMSARVRRVGSGEFTVPSDSRGNAEYTVIINGENSSCTCCRFRRTKMPCKHFFLVGMVHPECHPYRLLGEILINPVYCIDRAVIAGAASGNVNASSAQNIYVCEQNVHSEQEPEVVKQKSPGDSSRKKLLNSCKGIVRSIESMLYQLPEDRLKEFE